MFGHRGRLLIARAIDVHAAQLRLDGLDALLLLVRGGVAKHQVHVLERLALRLRDEEVREGEGDQTEGREEDVGAPADGGEHVGGDEADDEVAHPRARGGDGDCLGADGEREDL